MGFFKDFRNWNASKTISDNGLPRGSGIEVCEKCCYRVQDNRSSYLVCAQHRFHVSAEQVCGEFRYGDPLYQMT